MVGSIGSGAQRNEPVPWTILPNYRQGETLPHQQIVTQIFKITYTCSPRVPQAAEMKLSLSFIERLGGYAVASPLQDQQKMPKKREKNQKNPSTPTPLPYELLRLPSRHTSPHIIVYYTRRNELFLGTADVSCGLDWATTIGISMCSGP